MNVPLPDRPPASRLDHAREDHERCLRLAAWYRELHRRGEAGMIEQHAFVLGYARRLRVRFPGQLSRASPG